MSIPDLQVDFPQVPRIFVVDHDQGRRQEFEEGGAELFTPETTWRGAPKIPVTGSHTP